MVKMLSRSVFKDIDISESADEAFDKASMRVAELIRETLITHEYCRIVVSGGRSIQLTLERLAQLTIPWQNVLVFVADERCVEAGNDLRNDAMIRTALLNETGIPSAHFFNIHTELGGIAATQNYRDVLVNVPNFDIALLGVGPDGHIGSLFPDHRSMTSTELALYITDSPKEPPNRVSVGIGMLQRASHRIVVVVGEDKSAMVARVNNGIKLPVTLFDPIIWFLDRAAVRDQRLSGAVETKAGLS